MSYPVSARAKCTKETLPHEQNTNYSGRGRMHTGEHYNVIEGPCPCQLEHKAARLTHEDDPALGSTIVLECVLSLAAQSELKCMVQPCCSELNICSLELRACERPLARETMFEGNRYRQTVNTKHNTLVNSSNQGGDTVNVVGLTF